ncbi:MAG TPA: hypothetical protein VN622_09570 [Clostridia bacterium]|nr:hypothetical protein [Clostridia bacterium]
MIYWKMQMIRFGDSPSRAEPGRAAMTVTEPSVILSTAKDLLFAT